MKTIGQSGSDINAQYSENQPEFPGGIDSLNSFINRNLQYPDSAFILRVQGTVYASFIIDKDGSVNGHKIIRGIGWGCDKEALRILKLMPRWKPGFQNGKPVRMSYNVAIKFTIPDSICQFNKAVFPGGSDSLENFIRRNINYGRLKPGEVRSDIVTLSLFIDKEGDITDAVITHPIYGGCDEEALRIVKKMPKWIPAHCNDTNTSSVYILRIRFRGKRKN